VERYVTLIRVTPEGGERYASSGDWSAELVGIVEACGGTSEGVWNLKDGPYQLVALATYPDRACQAKARAAFEELGLATVEGYPAEELAECLQAMAA
jgi:uncharacterized protein with GYD domain